VTRLFPSIVCMALLAGCALPSDKTALPGGRTGTLVWHDEFDGDALDTSKWMFRTNFWGKRAHWLARPEDGCVAVSNGVCRLMIKKLPDGQFVTPQLQTGELLWDMPRVDSDSFWFYPKRRPALFEHKYGYYECRARLQREKGWWSAFWMQTVQQGASLDPERSGVEHDIMESFEPGIVIPACFHQNGGGKDYQGFRAPRVSSSDDLKAKSTHLDTDSFHTFGMLWEPDGYTLFIDGVQRGEKVGKGKDLQYGFPEAVSQVPEFILISTEAKFYRERKGTGSASPDLERAAAAGDDFVVDYVRVYDVD